MSSSKHQGTWIKWNTKWHFFKVACFGRLKNSIDTKIPCYWLLLNWTFAETSELIQIPGKMNCWKARISFRASPRSWRRRGRCAYGRKNAWRISRNNSGTPSNRQSLRLFADSGRTINTFRLIHIPGLIIWKNPVLNLHNIDCSIWVVIKQKPDVSHN